MALRSPPALKNRPVPVIVTTFVASVSQSAVAAANSRSRVSFIPLAASGRLSTMLVMGPDWANVSVSKSGMAQTVSQAVLRHRTDV